MGYGKRELLYAEPFADALSNNEAFRLWVLRKTKFSDLASDVRLLHREMLAQRAAGTKYWWRSHFTETCRCLGCSGKETDLLAIFETSARTRFALHVEVKHPGDRFKGAGDQAAAYPIRARCWATTTPVNILPHTMATTVLLCSELKLTAYAPHLQNFETLITFEEIEGTFPNCLTTRFSRRGVRS